METGFLALFGVWAAMMAAMMLPSALPMFAVFQQISRRHQAGLAGITVMFVFAYGSVWLLFCLLMAWLQWRLGQWSMGITATWLTGFLFVLAGLYQFSPWKQGCLKGCRSPFGFLLSDWRPGYVGAGWMGFRYGFFCLGCCWALMLLMLGVGVMSLAGMLVLTMMVTVEKLFPVDPVILTRINGSLLLVWAGVLLLGQWHGD